MNGYEQGFKETNAHYQRGQQEVNRKQHKNSGELGLEGTAPHDTGPSQKEVNK
jgi:hypothetical protein